MVFFDQSLFTKKKIEQYNYNMDKNSRHQDFFDQQDFSFGIFRPSPCLSPMFLSNMDHSASNASDDLANFSLQKPQCALLGNFDDVDLLHERQIQSIQQNPQKTNLEMEVGSSSNSEIESVNPLHKQDISRLQAIIELLIQNTSDSQEHLNRKVEHLIADSSTLFQVYKLLAKKFKKLKKTKEEMTKYCMRKAFKVISDNNRNFLNRHSGILSSNPTSSPRSPSSLTSFLKKINSEKTMNGNFLKKIFSEQNFLQDYNVFLIKISSLIEEDNKKKVHYLTKVINQYMQTNNLKKIQGIKRLPWTREILNKTQQLGRQLPKYADPDYVQTPRRRN